MDEVISPGSEARGDHSEGPGAEVIAMESILERPDLDFWLLKFTIEAGTRITSGMGAYCAHGAASGESRFHQLLLHVGIPEDST
jgi:hypothetical protein